MALLYSYLFPTIFLLAFWVLYRYEQVPLVRHLGELLTVTALGGACFGLPTTMVSERERGVWRRYRLTPVSTATLVAGTVVARYLLLVIAGLLQLALAMALGMPMPRHPFDLFVAFTLVAFAFIGLGLVIAMLADNVPAVQALGQCIFLPMLIIGGVAVPLASLPDWAQRLSAFFPGRYAVEAIQACVTGDGLGAARLQRAGARRDRRRRLPGGREDVSLGRAAAVRDAPGQGLGRGRAGRVGRRRRHGRNRAGRKVAGTLAAKVPATSAGEPVAADSAGSDCRRSAASPAGRQRFRADGPPSLRHADRTPAAPTSLPRRRTGPDSGARHAGASGASRQRRPAATSATGRDAGHEPAGDVARGDAWRISTAI